jgi:hypothetical protein
MARRVRPQAGKRERDESAYGSLGPKLARRVERVKAIGSQLGGGHIAADVSVRDRSCDQPFEEAREVCTRMADVFAMVERGGELGTVVFVLDQRVVLHHRSQTIQRWTPRVRDRRKLRDVRAHVALVPGRQDRLDAREVLVQGRPPDPSSFGDLRHGHRIHAELGGQRCGGVEDGLADLASMRLDRLAPHLRHEVIIRNVAARTGCLDSDTLSCKCARVKYTEVTEPHTGMPRWVKAFVIIGAVLAVLLVVGLVFGKGEHGPGRHGGGGDRETPTSHVLPVEHAP